MPTRKQITTHIQFVDQKISELKRVVKTLQELSLNHSEELGEKDDDNQHKYGAFDETSDQLLESISDFEEFGLNSIRNLKS